MIETCTAWREHGDGGLPDYVAYSLMNSIVRLNRYITKPYRGERKWAVMCKVINSLAEGTFGKLGWAEDWSAMATDGGYGPDAVADTYASIYGLGDPATAARAVIDTAMYAYRKGSGHWDCVPFHRGKLRLPEFVCVAGPSEDTEGGFSPFAEAFMEMVSCVKADETEVRSSYPGAASVIDDMVGGSEWLSETVKNVSDRSQFWGSVLRFLKKYEACREELVEKNPSCREYVDTADGLFGLILEWYKSRNYSGMSPGFVFPLKTWNLFSTYAQSRGVVLDALSPRSDR